MISSSHQETKRLQELNQINKKKAQELAQKIDDAQIDYQKKIREAEEKVSVLKAKAVEDAEKIKAKILTEAKQEKEFIIQQAINEKDKVREEISEEIRKASGKELCEILQRVLSAESQKLFHEGLVAEVLAELKNVGKETFPKEEKVFVTVAETMSEESKEQLQIILKDKMDGELMIKEVIDKAILGGMIIQMGSLVIDGSLIAKLKENNK